MPKNSLAWHLFDLKDVNLAGKRIGDLGRYYARESEGFNEFTSPADESDRARRQSIGGGKFSPLP